MVKGPSEKYVRTWIELNFLNMFAFWNFDTSMHLIYMQSRKDVEQQVLNDLPKLLYKS